MPDEKPLNPNFRNALLNRLPERMAFWNLLGIAFVEVERGRAKMCMPFTEKLTNSTGAGHGGALFTLADSAASMALVSMAAKGEVVTTVEMKINFLKPFTHGEVVAEARILHCGKKTALGDVEIRDQAGALIAKGSATLLRKR